MATDVSSIIETQQAFATTAVTDGNAFLEALRDIANSSYFYVSSNARVPQLNFGVDNTQDAIALIRSLFPAALEIQDIVATAPTHEATPITESPVVQVPDFTASAPAVDLPQPPDATLPAAPTPVEVREVTLPEAPAVVLPTAPTIADIALPDVPAIVIPEFTSTLPIDTLVVPSNTFAFYEAAYQSELLDATKAKLLDGLENGGYGIEPADEAALWDRARDREVEAASAQMDDLINQVASRGFPVPPGDMLVALQRAQQELLDKMSSVSRDIALKRADLYVDNRKFTIGEVRGLETVLIGYHTSVQERALNAAKATLDASIQVYNAQVSKYNAQLDAYKTEAQVFESRLRAALSHIEIYKAEIEGKRVASEIQRTRVEVYNAQINGVNAVINLYKTRMEAAQVQAQIEQLRLSAYRTMVEAFATQVQAKTAEFGLYESRIKGEMSKVQIYDTQARAYVAVVQGAKVRSDVEIARLNAQVTIAQQTIDEFKARIAAYQSDIEGQARIIGARANVYTAQTQGAAAQSNAISEAYRLDITKKDLELKRNIENARIALEDAKNLLTAAVSSAQVRLGATQGAANYYAALVGSALNSIGTLSSLVQQL